MTHLTPGKVIDLQLGGLSGVRIKPTVIGLDIGRYLLEGTRGECVSFSTTIEHIITVPEKLHFLNYPTKIENRQLRTHQREKTHLPAQISQKLVNGKLAGTLLGGYIVDISPRGCQFSFKQEGGNSAVKKMPSAYRDNIDGI
ncbi:hypothetical protein ACMAZF_09690 [Psychrobium sp. nBUS_13]|uniref:hypothetical protein n=1 Tax=Psychrobium sp. nBUS_13 TaxID=3395319 RepID=UPI003EC06547